LPFHEALPNCTLGISLAQSLAKPIKFREFELKFLIFVKINKTSKKSGICMPSQVVVIGSKVGLHARPAALLIKACAAAGVPVTIGRVGETAVNAASMLSVLALGAKCGESVEITVGDGPDSARVLTELVEIVQTDHDA
jgi:phosphocarrier protein